MSEKSNTKYQVANTSQKAVWTFTNQKQLTKSEFINYFERKIFKTIRQYSLMPKDKIFTLKKSEDLNTIILKQILEKKFQVKLIPTTDNRQPNTQVTNLSKEAEIIFENITAGNFNHETTKSPLINLSDKEIELYASLKKIKGEKRFQNKKIQSLFQKFLPKNQDLEINIINAQNQLKQKSNQ